MFTHQPMISNQWEVLDIVVILWVPPFYREGGRGYFGYEGSGPSGYVSISSSRYPSVCDPDVGPPRDGAYEGGPSGGGPPGGGPPTGHGGFPFDGPLVLLDHRDYLAHKSLVDHKDQKDLRYLNDPKALPDHKDFLLEDPVILISLSIQQAYKRL